MPLTRDQTKVLFLTACMGSRLMLALLAATVSLENLRVLGALGAVVAAGFMTIYLGKLRPVGVETGGRPIWWNSWRPFHAVMYAAFAYFAWTGSQELAWMTLTLDAAIGLLAFVRHDV